MTKNKFLDDLINRLEEIKDIDERFWPFAERVVRREGDANE